MKNKGNEIRKKEKIKKTKKERGQKKKDCMMNYGAIGTET